MSADTGRDDVAVGTDDELDEPDELHEPDELDEHGDDEALSWGESSDKSYVEGPVVERSGWQPDQGLDDDEDDEDELPPGVMSSGLLVAHGVAAAIFLLFTVAWLKSIGSVAPSFDSALADWMWRIGTWFAVASPVVWFLATVFLVPASRSRRRLVWFLVGILVLLPWPFLIGALA